MAQQKTGGAGITTREIDQSGRGRQEPAGVPAGIVGTALRGPAFVPLTFGDVNDFYARFGKTDGKKFGPLAVTEWMRNATSVTYTRVLGVGDGKKALSDGTTAGSVTSAGFVVGENQPSDSADGALAANPYANTNGEPGRTYFLGCFMSESAGSAIFSDARIQGAASTTPGVNTAIPVIRGMLMMASGVVARLSSSYGGVNSAPASTLVGNDTLASGSHIGHVTLLRSNEARQEFVMFLNGHKGTDTLYPNVLTASFDMTAPNYFVNVFNTDPYKLNEAGHYLYSHWDVHPTQATVTGSGIVYTNSGSSATATAHAGQEACAFLTTGSAARNTGNSYAPNFENFEYRFSHAKTPWIISQDYGGIEYNLFRFHALDAGANISNLYKISIENIVASSDEADLYPNFDVVIRSWDDIDGSLQPLEQWRGLNLNPGSERYIARVIGDMHTYFDFDRSESAQKIAINGSYDNSSAYVRVEVHVDVENGDVDAEAFPMGFRGHYHLATSGSMPLASPSHDAHSVSSALKRATTPPVPLRQNITAGTGAKQTVNPVLYWGVQFEHATSVSTPNASTMKNKSIDAFAKFYPDFMTNTMNVSVGDNEGTITSTENGIEDADLFCHNKFTLQNIKVVTGSVGTADPSKWDDAVYVRDGNISTDDSAKTRKLSINDFTQANRRYLKYSLFMQGGFDGVNLFNEDEVNLSNKAVTEDIAQATRGLSSGPNVKAYTKALDVMKDTSLVDIKLLAIPGIRASVVQDALLNAAEERYDTMAIVDIEQYDTSNTMVTSDSQITSVDYTVQAVTDRAFDSSFGAAYFPDVVIQDPNTKTNVVVPPSVVVLGAMALNDRVGHPWFAPAGYARGALQTTLEAKVRLSQDNIDALANININPLVAFPGAATSGTNPKGGVVVWGQKTLQVQASSLDRVNVRRLLIELRRIVRDVVKNSIFEPSREATLSAITATLTPKFRRVQALSGLDKFKIVFDASTTTQADIENNTLRGKIFVKPTKTIEYVSIDFVVSNNPQVNS